MSEKNMLAILGSPHTNGITAAMLDFAIRKAEQAGYTITKINLYEKKLSFCMGCRACMDTHICVQKDDIRDIVALLQKCQIVILAAPVYWANVPAPVKNLFDRLLGTAMEETDTFPRPRLRGKQYMIFRQSVLLPSQTLGAALHNHQPLLAQPGQWQKPGFVFSVLQNSFPAHNRNLWHSMSFCFFQTPSLLLCVYTLYHLRKQLASGTWIPAGCYSYTQKQCISRKKRQHHDKSQIQEKLPQGI